MPDKPHPQSTAHPAHTPMATPTPPPRPKPADDAKPAKPADEAATATPVSTARNKSGAPVPDPTPDQVAHHEQDHERESEPQNEGEDEGAKGRRAPVEVHEGDTVVFRERNPVTGEMHECIARVTRVAGDRLDLIATYNVGPEDHTRHAVAPLQGAKGPEDRSGWRPVG